MTIYERALELVPDGAILGLGSGHAAEAFLEVLARRLQGGELRVRGVPTSEATAAVARSLGIPLVPPGEVEELTLTVDGADEVSPGLDLIKGYGRALVREKIVASASRQLVILAGQEKLVEQLGSRGRLPIEVVPFALPLVERRLRALGMEVEPCREEGELFLSDNANHILDCHIGPLADPVALEASLRAIPGVVGTGLFLGMADRILVGDSHQGFRMIEERVRS